MKRLILALALSLSSALAFAAGQNNCTASPDSCVTQPIAHACPTGYHWTTAGSNKAHCVQDDPACPVGQSVTHDYLGNPSCITCATSTTESGSCQAGYTGLAYRTKTVDSCAGTTSYSGWDYSSCSASCGTSSSTQSGSCPSGYTGTAYRSQTVNSCNGSTTYGAWDYSSCNASCGTSTSTESGSCQSGYTGTAYRDKTVDSCAGTTSYGAWDYSSCSPTSGSGGVSPPCGSSTTTESGACQTGYTGSASRAVTTNTCTSTTSYGAWDYSGCTSCTSTNTTETSACSSGYNGTQTRSVTTNNCTGSTTYGIWDTSSCSAAVAPPACTPGYGSTSAGVTGYCTDCDTVAWVDTWFASNRTSTQRACFLTYCTKPTGGIGDCPNVY